MATSSGALDEVAVGELRARLRGPAILPGDAGYDEGRLVWNGAISRRPAIIIRATGTSDVMAAVGFARLHELSLAVRGGGHNVAGFGTCDDGAVVDLAVMRGIRVDPATGTARVQGGATWGDFDHEAQAVGLATTGGLVSTTGVAGLTLGGGIGWLMRSHGLAADNMIAADLVTADGNLISVNERSHPDLLWALRGGGGNFGVVTSFEFSLHPIGPIVYGGAIFYPAEHAGELLDFYARWTRDLPDELTTMAVFLMAPPAPFIPADLHGTPMIVVACCYSGDPAAGPDVVSGLRNFGAPVADAISEIPYSALQQMFDSFGPRGIHAYWKTHYLQELTGPAISTLTEQAGELPALFPMSMVHLHHLEGAVSREPADGSAVSHRESRFVVNILGQWQDETATQKHVQWVRDTWEAMRVHSSGDPYLNFLGNEGMEPVRASYGPDIYERLVAVKRKYDPTNFFHINQNIPPG